MGAEDLSRNKSSPAGVEIFEHLMGAEDLSQNKSSPAGVEIFEHLMGAEDLSRIKSSPDGAAGGRLDLSNPTANKSGAELFSY